MKLASHDETFSMLMNKTCDKCEEGKEYQAYIETIKDPSILCLNCALEEGQITKKEHEEGEELEDYYVSNWEVAESKRKAGEAEFLKRMKGPDYAETEEEG